MITFYHSHSSNILPNIINKSDRWKTRKSMLPHGLLKKN